MTEVTENNNLNSITYLYEKMENQDNLTALQQSMLLDWNRGLIPNLTLFEGVISFKILPYFLGDYWEVTKGMMQNTLK